MSKCACNFDNRHNNIMKGIDIRMKRRTGLPKRVIDICMRTYGHPYPPVGVSEHIYDDTRLDWYETAGLVVRGNDEPTESQLRVLDFCIEGNMTARQLEACGFTGKDVLTKQSLREILKKAVPISKRMAGCYRRHSCLDELIPDFPQD